MGAYIYNPTNTTGYWVHYKLWTYAWIPIYIHENIMVIFSRLDAAASILFILYGERLQFERDVHIFQLVSSRGDVDVWVRDYWQILDSKTREARD